MFAPGIEGRWNSTGKRVLYCSESVPLAFLESMIRRQGVGFNNDFQIAHIDIPDSAEIKTLTIDDLQKGWDDPHNYSKCQPLADLWYDNMESLVLRVPSAALSLCNNYVLNTLHPHFSKVKLLKMTQLMPDKRIDEILKKGK